MNKFVQTSLSLIRLVRPESELVTEASFGVPSLQIKIQRVIDMFRVYLVALE